DVVDGNHAQKLSVVARDGGGQKVVAAEKVGDLLAVHGDGDGRVFVVDKRVDLDGALRAKHAAEGHGAHKTVHGVDDVDVVELVGQGLGRRAQVVDGLADRPEFRNGDEFALHQAARAVFLEGQALLDRGAHIAREVAHDVGA